MKKVINFVADKYTYENTKQLIKKYLTTTPIILHYIRYVDGESKIEEYYCESLFILENVVEPKLDYKNE